jgi:uncharacterized membrane protein
MIIMGKLSDAKTFGGIGAIAMLIGPFIPFIGIIIAIVGLVLLFIAVKYIADETKDHPIFKNYLLYFLCYIIATVAVIAILFVVFGGVSFFVALQNIDPSDPTAFIDNAGDLLVGCALALVVGWILMILGTLYLKKSYTSIAEHTKVDLFRTTGTVYFIGAITTIIAVGLVIMLVARILEIVAFFSLPDELPAAAEAPKESEVPT